VNYMHFIECLACSLILTCDICVVQLLQEHLGFAGAGPMPMLTSPYGAAAAKLNCLSPPLPTLGTTPSSRKSFHPWKKMADGHYPFAHAPHYHPAMTSSLGGSREMTSDLGGVCISDGSGGGFPMHGYSYRGTGMSSSCAMAPACVLPPGAGATAAVPAGDY